MEFPGRERVALAERRRARGNTEKPDPGTPGSGPEKIGRMAGRYVRIGAISSNRTREQTRR